MDLFTRFTRFTRNHRINRVNPPITTDPCGYTDFHIALRNSDLEKSLHFIKEWSCEDLSIQDCHGWTGFHYACYNFHVYGAMDKLVFKLTPDQLSIQDRACKWTGFHHVCARNHLHTAELLLEKLKYEHIITGDSRGCTGLHYACANGHLDMVKLILSRYPHSTRIKSYSGSTALHCSIIANKTPIVQELLYYDCSSEDLVNIFRHGREEAVEYLYKQENEG